MMHRLLLFVLPVLLGGFTDVTPWQAMVDAGHPEQAFAAATAGAAEGDAGAIDYLGWLYDTGTGTPADDGKALALYRRAGTAGQPHAQWRLGVMLDEGDGVTPDPDEAVEWFRRAAAQGYSNAYVSLGVMYSAGRGVAQDYRQALANYREAARRGNAHGFSEIGVVFHQGEGVPRDLREAAAWFTAAGLLHDEAAPARLQQTMDELDADEATNRAIAARAKAILREYGAPPTS